MLQRIDVLVEHGIQLAPIEIKASATPSTALIEALQKWVTLAGDAAEQPAVIYGGVEQRELAGIELVPWNAIDEVASRI